MSITRKYIFWIKKADGRYEFDKRKVWQTKAYFALGTISILWAATMAIARVPKGHIDNIEQLKEIIEAQQDILLWLLGAVASLIGFVYVQGTIQIKSAIRSLHEKLDKKMDLVDHDRYCTMIQELSELKRGKASLERGK